uniref:Distal membrane-arm assembly complex protein 1-like domain-containing protein n=1 Tax=Glossina morsitans morsitans TaxID=37546 RepID=A0A905AWG8_GLOMM
MTERSPKKPIDCLECRLISGIGSIGVGLYLYYQSLQRKRFERYTMKIICAGAVLVGLARLLNMEFLKATRSQR